MQIKNKIGKTQTMTPVAILDFCLLVACIARSFRPPPPILFLTFSLGLGGRSLLLHFKEKFI